MKKILSLLLASLFVFLPAIALSSCGNSTSDETQPEQTQAIATAVETEPAETAPALDEWGREVVSDDIPAGTTYAGETLKILSRLDTAGKDRWSIDFYAKEANGVRLNDAVYNRNEAIKERLGIDIKITEIDGSYNVFDSYAKVITTAHQSGSHEYDVVGTYSLYGAQYATGGHFKNVLSLSSNLNLDKVWWNQTLRDDLTISNKLYFVVGDMNITTLTRMLVTFVNKETFSSKYQDVDLYQTVRDGKWTIDYLAELISASYVDSNGNGSADDGDFYGILSVSPSEAFDSFASALNVQLFERTADGSWALTENTDYIYSAVEKTVNLYFKNPTNKYFTSIDNCLKKFSANEALFLILTLDKTGEEYLSAMQSDYGILPLPKYDEEQKMYYTIPQDAFNLVSVMADVENPDMVAAALELMSAGSYKTVTPEYFEEVLKYRYARDSDSGAMLDYLREGLRFDFATINTLSLSDAGRWFRNICSSGTSAGAATAFKVLKKTAGNYMTKLEEAYAALE